MWKSKRGGDVPVIRLRQANQRAQGWPHHHWDRLQASGHQHWTAAGHPSPIPLLTAPPPFPSHCLCPSALHRLLTQPLVLLAPPDLQQVSFSKPFVIALTQHSTDLAAEVPCGSQLLKAAQQQPSHSQGDASPASDDSSNAARIATMEHWQDEIEKCLQEFNRRLKTLGA